MNLLLDTHVLLWWLDDSPHLSKEAKNDISSVDNLIVLSAVVVWEIRIKQATGKLEVTSEFFDVVQEQGFEQLSITCEHANGIRSLPMYHRDPFDRMLISQAKLNGLTIMTHDAVFEKYDVPVVLI